MSYCYGFEKECIVNNDPKTTTLQKSITACSDLSPLSIFDPGKANSDAMGGSEGTANGGDSGGGDSDSDDPDGGDGAGGDNGPGPKWPSYLTDDFIALAPTSQVMSMLFILGTSTVAVSIFLRLSTIRYTWRPPGPPSPLDDSDPPPGYPGSPTDFPPPNLQILSLVVSITRNSTLGVFLLNPHIQVSLILLTIGSSIATLISTQFVGLITKSGSPDFFTSSSSGFLGMAWTAVGIQALLTTDVLVALIRWKSRHCRCDYDELPSPRDPESKRLVSSSY